MRRFVLTCALAALTACDVSSPEQLVVFVNATPSAAAVGDTIDFVVTAQGPSLDLVVINYGDGDTEDTPAAGATSVQFPFRHVYQSIGTYQVQATAFSGATRSQTASLSVSIQ